MSKYRPKKALTGACLDKVDRTRNESIKINLEPVSLFDLKNGNVYRQYKVTVP